MKKWSDYIFHRDQNQEAHSCKEVGGAKLIEGSPEEPQKAKTRKNLVPLERWPLSGRKDITLLIYLIYLDNQ